MTWVRKSRRPFFVASTMPMMASTTAMTTSSLLLAGSLKPLAALPGPGQEHEQQHEVHDGPGGMLSPTPVTAFAGSTPAFCMNRTFRAMPPTLAGVTRLTN